MEARQLALKSLQDTLAKSGMPQPLADLLVALLSSPSETAHLDPTMHHLVHRQTHLGLLSLHRGHISTAWRDTDLAALPKESQRKAERADARTKKAIVAIWTYSLALWEARNTRHTYVSIQ
jgi:hypothetical protein